MCWIEIKKDAEDILYKKVGVEEAGIYKISKITVNILELKQLFEEEMNEDLEAYIDKVRLCDLDATNGGDRWLGKEDVLREKARDSVRRFNEVKLLKKKWDGFWKEVLGYC
jgi:hypothetical protein